MKNPNGYGAIIKLGGKRRKPFAVRVTTTYDIDLESKRHIQKRKYIGFFADRKEAMIALADYNQHPYSIDAVNVTFGEMFEKWSAEAFPKISDSNVKGYQAAYKVCESIAKVAFKDIRKSHLQGVIDHSGKNAPTLKKVKSLMHQLFRFAMENDIVTKDYSEFVDISQAGNPNAIDRQPFSTDEINKLWAVQESNVYFTTVLMLIYTGVRVSELLDLKKENVNLEERWFDIIASKTEAGIRRVPIAKKVLPFFEYWFSKNDCEYLLSNESGKHFSYSVYLRNYWEPLLTEVNMQEHRPHDTRHTCVSLLTMKDVKLEVIRKIVGHQGKSLTEVVYTHFDFQVLIDAIDLI